MGFVSPGDIVRATVRLAHPYTSAIENVWHFYVDGTGVADGDDVLTAVDDFLRYVYATVDAFMHDDTTLESVIVNTLGFVVDHWTTLTHLGQFFTITDFAPAYDAELLPAATSFMLRYQTYLAGTEGRKYLAPFTEYSNVDDQIASGLTDLGALVLINTLLYEGDIPNSTLTLSNIVLNATQELYNYADVGAFRNRWNYQRRRRDSVGI